MKTKASKQRTAAAKKRSAKVLTERTNKKAAVLAMIKGATLAEIPETTGWQAHTVRGFVSIPGSKAARNRVVQKTPTAS